MGEVISFRRRQHAGRARDEGDAAQILFFTGVRYTREDSPATKPGQKSPKAEQSRGGGKVGGGRPRRRG